MNLISMNMVTLLYLVASVCFIQALKGLSSPSSARAGNAFGMTGMAIAVLTTIALIFKLQAEFAERSGGGMGFTLVLLGVVGAITLVLLFLAQSCMGLVLGNAVAMAQRQAQRLHLSGTGSAVVGMAQFILAGLVTPLTGLGGEYTAVPMALSMAACAVISVGLVLTARRQGTPVG